MLRRSPVHPNSQSRSINRVAIPLLVWVAFFRSLTWTTAFPVVKARSRWRDVQRAYFSVTQQQQQLQQHQSSNVILSSTQGRGDDDKVDNAVFPDSLIDALDLIPLLRQVARHTATRRGHQALLSLVKEDQETLTNQFVGHSLTQQSSRRLRAEMTQLPPSLLQRKLNPKEENPSLVQIAMTAEEARHEYELVEAATLALVPNAWNLTFPPIYGTESNPTDTTTIADTDHDEWLTLPADAWSLEHILQAEQVIKTLLQAKDWAQQESTQTWMPGVAQIGARIDLDNTLPAIWNEISGQVEIVRFRTLSGSSVSQSSSASYSFRLCSDRYPILKILRDKEQQLFQAGGKELDSKVVAIQTEIESVESQIRAGLAQVVLGAADVIDAGFHVVARLDVIFAKAAFGHALHGAIPRIGSEGIISVPSFVHPLLALNDGFTSNAASGQAGHVTPIDLYLMNNGTTTQGPRALLISGPNGGGKTLSMKSFGLVSILTKLGIPIPIAADQSGPRPRVDFIDNIFINIGDKQDVIRGESTWTSLMNSCARMLEQIRSHDHNNNNKRHLVLLDELGSGTDPEAGGAVAQAILEEFLSISECQIVATTHSPRLKTLSYNNKDFACATVLLEMSDRLEYKRPSFQLAYGIIGESYALGAASRCHPSLPPSVLSRASQLLADKSSTVTTNGRAEYIQALTSSMEDQLQRMQQERIQAEENARDSFKCRQAMLSLAASYETQLKRMEDRLDDFYRRLKHGEDKEELEIIGDTIAQLRLVKKQLKSQQDLLREKGLKLLPVSYKLTPGESVILVSQDSDWDSPTVQVVADASSDSSLGATEVLVRATSSFLNWDNSFPLDANSNDLTLGQDSSTRIVQRHELAIWDYDSMWEDKKWDDNSITATSIPNSKQRLNAILSTLKSDKSNPGTPVVVPGGPTKGNKIKKSFLSARARKANNQKNKK